MKRLKKILKLILLLAVFGLVYSFFFTTYENIKLNKVINDFKDRGELDERREMKVSNFTYYRDYYIVPRETTDELNDQNNVFYDDNKTQLGINGDIFATKQSPFPNNALMHAFMSYYYGGHAAIINYNELGSPSFLEATGYPASDETIFDYIFYDGVSEHNFNSTAYNRNDNYWQRPSLNKFYDHVDGYFYRSKYMGLRATNNFLGEEKEELYNEYVESAVNSAKQIVEDERVYNFLFFLNMRYKYYCTDLVSRAYEEAFEKVYNEDEDYHAKGYAKKMNDDNFITSVQDLVLSRDTIMTFYVEINEEEINGETFYVESIYYLEDVN